MAESLYPIGTMGNPAYAVPSRTNQNPIEDRIISEYQRYLTKVRQAHGTRVGMGGQSLPTYQQFKTKYIREMNAATPKPIADPGEALGMALGYRNYQNVMERAAKRYNLPEVGMFAQRPEDYAAEYAARGAPKAPQEIRLTGSTITRAGDRGRGTMTPQAWAIEDIKENRFTEKMTAQAKRDAAADERRNKTLAIAEAREKRIAASAVIRDELAKARLAGDRKRVQELTSLDVAVKSMKPDALAQLDIGNIGRGLSASAEIERAKGAAVQKEAEIAAKSNRTKADVEQARLWGKQLQEDRQQHELDMAEERSIEKKIAAAANQRDTLQGRIDQIQQFVAATPAEELTPALKKYYDDIVIRMQDEMKQYADEADKLQKEADAIRTRVRGGASQLPSGGDADYILQWLRNPANRNDPDYETVRRKYISENLPE